MKVFAETREQQLDPKAWEAKVKQGINETFKDLLAEQSIYGDIEYTARVFTSPEFGPLDSCMTPSTRYAASFGKWNDPEANVPVGSNPTGIANGDAASCKHQDGASDRDRIIYVDAYTTTMSLFAFFKRDTSIPIELLPTPAPEELVLDNSFAKCLERGWGIVALSLVFSVSLLRI